MKKRNYSSRIFEFVIAALMSLFVGVGVSLAAPVNPMWIAGGLFALYLAQLFGMFAFARNPVRGLMLMALTAYNCTDAPGATNPYTPAVECLDEGTGILGIFLVKGGFNLTTVVDEASMATAITAENLIVIRDLEAYWPAATPVFIPGKSGRVERLARIDYDMPFSHESVRANLKFWNAVNNRRSYGVVFVTENYTAYTPVDRALEPVLCSIFGAPSGAQEFASILEIKGNIKWKSKDLVQYLDLFTVPMLSSRFQPS